MSNNKIQCNKCGYNPHQVPALGAWYCPKCGFRNARVRASNARKTPKYTKRLSNTAISRDQVMTQLYEQLTAEKENDIGYKTPYLNPDIPSILPIKRSRTKVFYKR